MPKNLLLFCGSLIFSLILFASIDFADARSGCCSHHGGVCTCRCCDGTALSTTCAPYYPSCSAPAPKPVKTTEPVKIESIPEKIIQVAPATISKPIVQEPRIEEQPATTTEQIKPSSEKPATIETPIPTETVRITEPAESTKPNFFSRIIDFFRRLFK